MSSGKPKTIKELFETSLSKKNVNRLEEHLAKTPLLVTELASLYNETYSEIKAVADETYLRGWDSFAFERVSLELIPEMIDYQLVHQSPYGAYDNQSINLIVGCYLPRLNTHERNRVWFTAHNVLWGTLGLTSEKLQRVAYRIEGGILFHYKIDVKEAYVEDDVFSQFGGVSALHGRYSHLAC